jgi:hypothetical protein
MDWTFQQTLDKNTELVQGTLLPTAYLNHCRLTWNYKRTYNQNFNWNKKWNNKWNCKWNYKANYTKNMKSKMTYSTTPKVSPQMAPASTTLDQLDYATY